MSLMMNRALVILVLVGYVFCEETDPKKKLPIQDAAPPDLNSTSSVVIHNKVQNLTFGYKNDHSPTKNTSYVIRPATSSSNTTQEKPLIISTSKEVRFIQNPSKLNNSLAISTIESNSSQRHSNTIKHKNHTNNHKQVAHNVLPTLLSTEPKSTTSRPKISEKSFDNRNDGPKFSSVRNSGTKDYSYSYFKMSKLIDDSSTIKNSTSNITNSISSYNKNISSTNQNNSTPIITNSTKATPTYRLSVTPAHSLNITPTYRPSITPTYRLSITSTYKPSITTPYRPSLASTYGSSVTPSYNKSLTPTDVAVEKMAVKEMRSMKDEKNNSKFQFFMVADYDSADLYETPQKDTPTIKDKLLGKIQGNNQQPKPLVNKERNGHSKPYNEDLPPKKHSGFGHFHLFPQKSTTGQKLTTLPESTTPVPASTVRPGRYHLNTSKTFSPLPSHKKFNASSLNLVKNESSNLEGCLNCVESNKNKQLEYPTYLSKNKEHSKRLQAVKLLGPDGDSILGDSEHHYTISRPVTPHQRSNSSKRRVPKSGLNNYYQQHHGYQDQRERRKPFQGLDSAGSYSSHVGGTVEYMHRPEPGLYPETGFRTRGTKKPDMSDLYNLDELESSGSSISSSHVKYETKEIHIPYAVTVEKKVSYPIHIKVDRPVPVRIDKPYPVHVEKKVPVPVKVNVPQPYPVEKEVPFPVKIPIEVPRPVEVAKPIPYIVEKPVPIQVIKEVKFPVKVPVDVPVPYKVPIQVEKRIPYFVEKKVPFEVPVAVEKPYFIEIKKPFEVPVEKPHPVTVEKKIPVPMQVIEFVKVPIPVRVPIEGYSDYLHRSSYSGGSREKDGGIGVVPAPKLGDSDTTSGENRTEESKLQDRMGIIDTTHSNGRAHEQPSPPRNIPRMISIEFSHPDLNEDPRVTLYTDGSEELDSAKSLK